MMLHSCHATPVITSQRLVTRFKGFGIRIQFLQLCSNLAYTLVIVLEVNEIAHDFCLKTESALILYPDVLSLGY